MKALFVDDDLTLLRGLRRMLSAERGSWETQFASNGHDALTLMASNDFDVLVTDMRMPKMDGPELLSRVCDEYPSTIRVVLSGQASPESVLHVTGRAHQYIAKPCSSADLIETLSRTCEMQTMSMSESLKLALTRTNSLPVRYSTYCQMIREVEHPDSSTERVASVVTQDASLSARILQMANSAMFGMRSHFVSPRQAVAYLGGETIGSLVSHAGILLEPEPNVRRRAVLDTILADSFQVAIDARRIAATLGADDETQREAFTSGLLHDLGKVLLATEFPDEYHPILRESGSSCELLRRECDVWGVTHADVGAALLTLWGLPHRVCHIVGLHRGTEIEDEIDDAALASVRKAVVMNDVNWSGNKRPDISE